MALGAALGASVIYFWQRAKGNASIWRWSAAWVFGIGIAIAALVGFEIPRMLELPAVRAGLAVPAATAFISALLINPILAALGVFVAKKA